MNAYTSTPLRGRPTQGRGRGRVAHSARRTTHSRPTARASGDAQRPGGSYEEFHPYGTTALWSASSAIGASSKRYRYTGMQRDDETGMQYHSARYYAPWLGRWTAADPVGVRGGLNLYGFVNGGPSRAVDPSGHGAEPARSTPLSEGFIQTDQALSAAEQHAFDLLANDASRTRIVDEGAALLKRDRAATLPSEVMDAFPDSYRSQQLGHVSAAQSLKTMSHPAGLFSSGTSAEYFEAASGLVEGIRDRLKASAAFGGVQGNAATSLLNAMDGRSIADGNIRLYFVDRGRASGASATAGLDMPAYMTGKELSVNGKAGTTWLGTAGTSSPNSNGGVLAVVIDLGQIRENQRAIMSVGQPLTRGGAAAATRGASYDGNGKVLVQPGTAYTKSTLTGLLIHEIAGHPAVQAAGLPPMVGFSPKDSEELRVDDLILRAGF